MNRFAVSFLTAALLACGVTMSSYAQSRDTSVTDSSTYAQRRATTSETNASQLLRVLEDHTQYSTLVGALKKTGLHQSLGEGEYTLFAPTDSAFADLRMPVSEMQVGELADLLRNHILLKSYTVEQLAKLAQVQNVHGTNLKIGNEGQTVEGAQVADSDVEVMNGMVHGVNSVITVEARAAKATVDSTGS